MWLFFESTALSWLGIAFVAAIIEVSIPHFGSMFVSLGAVAGATAALLGFGVSVQLATFIVVMVVSLAALRSSAAMVSSPTTSIRRWARAASR